jgi:hypothetical protein
MWSLSIPSPLLVLSVPDFLGLGPWLLDAIDIDGEGPSSLRRSSVLFVSPCLGISTFPSGDMGEGEGELKVDLHLDNIGEELPSEIT